MFNDFLPFLKNFDIFWHYLLSFNCWTITLILSNKDCNQYFSGQKQTKLHFLPDFTLAVLCKSKKHKTRNGLKPVHWPRRLPKRVVTSHHAGKLGEFELYPSSPNPALAVPPDSSKPVMVNIEKIVGGEAPHWSWSFFYRVNGGWSFRQLFIYYSSSSGVCGSNIWGFTVRDFFQKNICVLENGHLVIRAEFASVKHVL